MADGRGKDDDELAVRQAALQAEAAVVLAELDLAAMVEGIGPLLATGSYVSGLMCWRELDVMVLVGAGFSPYDVLRLLRRIVDRPGVTGFDYRDERGARSPTGTVRDERYHVAVVVSREGQVWHIDLSLWLHDLHRNVTQWHEALRETITDEQRRAVLQIKDVWYRLPSYPHDVGGQQIYLAVLDDGVRTPEQFAAWLTAHGYPEAG
jgi:hypothetical protein